MHVPDGFIAPQVYLPSAAAAAGLWAYAARRVRRAARETAIPRLAVLTAFSFVLMMIALPLPGGSSAHATGIGLLAVLFGVWTSFLCVSLVLLLQALLLGAGGITSLPVNALAMGLAGSAAAWLAWRALRGVSEDAARFAAGYLGLAVPALLVALVLGAQPLIAHAADGSPLFFPFGLAVTLPAVMIPHLLLGVAEGLLTVAACRLLARLDRGEAP
ncbi:MAG: energy-coupling factor ABC transporter permease [Candidatus Krumholzibacteriota bacterium]|nr:energy-coupling factor ABC transporter permease [Candidatus Krumholzibacteriota bacterium]